MKVVVVVVEEWQGGNIIIRFFRLSNKPTNQQKKKLEAKERGKTKRTKIDFSKEIFTNVAAIEYEIKE